MQHSARHTAQGDRDSIGLMVIRPESSADARAVRSVLTAAFGGDDEAVLVELLHESGDDVVVSLVALVEGQIVGHVLFSRLAIRTNAGVLSAVALAPLAVLPAFQRSGIGSALVREGIRQLRDRGEAIAIVLGDPEYYARFDFSAELARPLRSRYAGPAFMALEIRPGALHDVAGDVTYPSAFDRF
jgi:putative acetyltransferase